MVCAKMDLPTVIKCCEDSGMEGVELRSTHKHGVEPTLDAAGREKVKEAFAKTKVKLVALGSACEFHSPKPEVVKKNIESTGQFVQLAADLGAWGVKVRPNGLRKDVPEDTTLRQIAGAFAELEKARLVAKLRGARERKRDANGKCEGRKAYIERGEDGERLVAAARELNDGRSLRKIAAALAEQGYLTPRGIEYSASAVKSMLGSEGSKSRAVRRTKASG